jgi:hypothetical protein
LADPKPPELPPGGPVVIESKRPKREDTTRTRLRRRQLKNYLIDRGLQLRYIVFVLIVSTVIAGTLGYLLHRQEKHATELIMTTLADEYDPALVEWVGQTKRGEDRSQLLIMIAIGIGLAVVLGGYLLVTTHKVAGPLYKISLYFDRMTDGKLPKVYDLRKGDQLQSFFHRFKEMDEALRRRAEVEVALYERLLAAAEQSGAKALGPELAALRERLDDKKRSLE